MIRSELRMSRRKASKSINFRLRYKSFDRHVQGLGPGGGDSGYTLCTGDVLPSRACFSHFCLGRMLFSAQQSGKGTFFTVSVWEGCCFQAQQARGVF